MQVPFDSSVRLHVVSQTAASNPLLVTNLEEWSNSTKDTVSLTQRVPFFKCFAIDIDLDTHITCSFTTNVRSEFTHHLKLEHKNALYACIYCSESENVKPLELFDMVIYLVRHIDAKHNNRIYQCNQCNYRAISPEHVSLHQSSSHTKSAISNCKVLSCAVPRPSCDLELEYFYEHFKVDNVCLSTYQCLYCNVYSISLSTLVTHLVENHPDYPMLYYLPPSLDISLQSGSSRSSSISSSSRSGFHSYDELYASNEDEEVMCQEEIYTF